MPLDLVGGYSVPNKARLARANYLPVQVVKAYSF